MRRNNKRLWIISACIAVCAATVTLLCCVACRIADEAGGCVAVVFDKWQVRHADRIVLRDGDTVITLTDQEQVRAIADNFIVANRSGLCGYYRDRWLEIYRGDKVVRLIHWNDHDDLVTAYEADATHWVFFGTKKGQIQLSADMVEIINTLLESAK